MFSGGNLRGSSPVGTRIRRDATDSACAYVGNNPLNATDPTGAVGCPANTDCIEATNYNAARAGTDTVMQGPNVDAAAVAELPNYETTGNTENGVRFDEDATGNVTTTQVPTTSTGRRGTITSTMSGVGGADAVGHSHPNDVSDPSPGPGDDAAVNAGYPNNIVHDGSVIVVEKQNGQFHVRVLNDNGLTSRDRREILRDVNLFQRRSQ